MTHVPFFRWVVALGLVVFGVSFVVYATAPEDPETKQVDLTVLSEKADGSCTVSWADPYAKERRKGHYQCDPDRDSLLKGRAYDPDTGHGWDTGWMVTEGFRKGDLFVLGQGDAERGNAMDLSDDLVGLSLVVLIVGVTGGSIRSLYRLSGASPAVVRTARCLEQVASRLAQDHARAVDAVRAAWEPLRQSLVDEALGRVSIEELRHATDGGFDAAELRRCGTRTARDVLDAGTSVLSRMPGVEPGAAERLTAAAQVLAEGAVRAGAGRELLERSDPRVADLLNALSVLVRVGPEGRATVQSATELAALLGPLLERAEPAADQRQMLRADAKEREAAKYAVGELRRLLATVEQRGSVDKFAQTSIDLLRGPDADPAGIVARVDFETRPEKYAHLLTELAVPEPQPLSAR
ncbi:hypothetical protein [Streptomyces sp. VRA16 Mangrove soil]|uniref:hypothetical protein n=1 Tax=Streptomyces sp. VRA16 Mangrove soil TaxID=2817434 RepID=UPI001A9FB86E|nr:hypothetical protein [Streptomyces sp. VRA16 Mangrove soil]MBO1332779.1 hypothetical protein [Streptomyces sp. VRA16 Mangrove soil]